jgi:SAM-dependent methyltransferase
VDLTPELLEAGRALAADEGVEIDWIEGDAEALPVESESFDVVVSVFGCMFAPRHDVAARELARALRRGGRFCVCAWTPEGAMGEFFRTLVGYLPPPPPGVAQPPLLWGSEDHVRGLFADTGIELEFERETIDFPRGSLDEEIEFATTKFGPLIMARRVLEPQGRWDELLADMRRLLQDPRPGEYLVTTGRKS